MAVSISDWEANVASIDRASEIGLRFCASRKYYLAYHSSKSLVGEVVYGEQGSHERLIRTLLEAFVSDDNSVEYRKLGYKLRAAKTLRAKADYELEKDFTSTDMAQLEGHIDYILTSISKLKAVA